MTQRRADTVQIRFVPGPIAPRLARTAVRKALRDVDPGLVERAMLLTSELVTNAVIHASTPLTLELTMRGSTLHVLVEDGAEALPVPVPVEESGAHGGFGLHIVERMSSAWGIAPRDNGKAVWFEMPLQPADDGRRRRDDAIDAEQQVA